ncbi:hypothetical protein GWO43_15585 [candidate division KSB1 bacterium]|nr:hypothetical protein [candidate division KSB1 bacterium]NIR68436.1 hypothetical protein [candidate division KSB1 bacterium]NIS25388.1 hypothetical protein [candidate division KSB1 bacterium]NIT72265.1 hypothetical protein [candidate division KSB1 bacterium]NIU26070.1 hypothetical protein [candidate division KSB1 bacterium]
MKKQTCSALILVALFFNSLFGQPARTEFIRKQTFKTNLRLKTWSFEEQSGFERFTEVVVPLTYTHPIGERFALDAVTVPYFSNVQFAGAGGVTLTHVTDTFLRGSYILGDNRALLTFGASIPSGKTKFDVDELQIAGLAANRPLANPVTNLGTGVNLNFGLAAAQDFGPWVFGLGVGYAWRGEYDVRNGTQEIEITPGNEVNLTFGMERGFELATGPSKFIVDFVYTFYTEDELAGQPFFEAGDKFLLQSSFIFPVSIFDPLIIRAQNRWRLDNESTNAALIDNGNEFDFGLSATHKLRNDLRLKYLLDAKIYSDTVNDSEGALIFGVGMGVFHKFSDFFSIDPTIKFYKGKIKTGPNSDIDVTGFEFVLGLSGGINLRF